MLEIDLEQSSNKWKLYKKTKLKIQEGITILIGKNGAGKTFSLHQIQDRYKHAYFIDIVAETRNNYGELKPR